MKNNNITVPERYSWDNLRKALRNPTIFLDETTRLLLDPIFRKIFFEKYEVTKNPLNKDWDNLIILDACRYDKINRLDNNIIGSEFIDASTSREFIQKYINGNEYHDTIYVSANPFAYKIEENAFFKIITPYNDSQFSSKNDKYIVDDLQKLWSPETMYQLAQETYFNNQNKRLIIHYMQPHAPYFGNRAKELRARLKQNHDIKFWAWDEKLRQKDKNKQNVLSHLLSAAKEGYISSTELIEVYEENLNIIYDYACKTSKNMRGKTVITSDHGEMLGESYYFDREKFGHQRRVYNKELRKVPWIVTNFEERRDVSESDPESRTKDYKLDDHLRALGYKD